MQIVLSVGNRVMPSRARRARSLRSRLVWTKRLASATSETRNATDLGVETRRESRDGTSNHSRLGVSAIGATSPLGGVARLRIRGLAEMAPQQTVRVSLPALTVRSGILEECV